MSLQEKRKERGLTQVELGEISGVNHRVIAYYEQGTKSIDGARLYTLLKLCMALKCSLSDILTDEETIEMLKKVKK